MKPATRIALVLVCSVLFVPDARAQLPADLKSDLGPGVPAFRVRPGFRIKRAIPEKVKELRNRDARFMEFSGDGTTLFMSQKRDGTILAFRDADADGVYRTITTFVKDRKTIHGLCWYDGWLYFQIPADGSVWQSRDTDGDGVADDVKVVIQPGEIPKASGHPMNALLVTGT